MNKNDKILSVLFGNADVSILSESEVYDLYDTVTEVISQRTGSPYLEQDFHFTLENKQGVTYQ
jgi:hypothetical protein